MAKSIELGRLAQGNCYEVQAANTITFIHRHEVPQHKVVTFTTFIYDHRPLKSEKWRARLVVGADKLPYPYDSCSPAANLLETTLLLNSTIKDATKGARFCTLDLKIFF